MTDTNTNNATTDLEDIAQPEDRGFRVRLKVVKLADKPEPKPAHAERKIQSEPAWEGPNLHHPEELNLNVIQHVDGTQYNDRLVGNHGNNTLDGWGGNDLLWGKGGNDFLIGGDGNDTLGGAGGDDTLEGGEGADVLDGGDGWDTATYANSREGVEVSLARNENGDPFKGKGGHAAGDTLKNIEHLIGSTYDDTLTGDSLANALWGGAGKDELNGAGGPDRLEGGSGADVLNGGVGDDVLDGQGGDDSLNGDAGDDHLYGRGGKDTLKGGVGDDVLNGGDGDDELEGGAGDDELDGGAGADTFVFRTGEAGHDTITGFTAGEDKIRIIAVSGEKLLLADLERESKNGNAVLYWESDSKITLIGVNPGGLTFDDFDFA